MNTHLKRIARIILKDELIKQKETLDATTEVAGGLSRDKKSLETKIESLEKKLKKFDRPDTVILSYYRVDDVSSEGMPPSYLNPENKTEYVQKISELEEVYRNPTFRELLAWALNFNANLSVTGKIRNINGDEIAIESQKANNMIQGIRSIWDLLTAAHMKDMQMSRTKNTDAYDALDVQIEED